MRQGYGVKWSSQHEFKTNLDEVKGKEDEEEEKKETKKNAGRKREKKRARGKNHNAISWKVG